MKDAFGGTFMLKVLMVFIVIYISFMTVAISYAKAFRIKNRVVSILETPAYSALDVTNTGTPLANEIDSYLRSVDYGDQASNLKVQQNCNHRGGELISYGVCVVDKSKKDATGNVISGTKYYEVTSYYLLEAPFFNISMLVPISGETKIIDL